MIAASTFGNYDGNKSYVYISRNVPRNDKIRDFLPIVPNFKGFVNKIDVMIERYLFYLVLLYYKVICSEDR